MQVNKVDYPVIASPSFQSRNFTIDVNSKAFDILINKIYSNKIGAIVRELATNAYDSHVEAGTLHIPFEVHLPNILEPFFHIRDYGTGITQEKIISTYSCLFRSDKTHSNELVGCMGLGSKTPFCYTEQFLVESYVDGICYSYFVHKDVNGIPCMSEHNNGRQTAERNGLKVSFVVKPEDYSDFAQEATNYYYAYKTRPNIVGCEVKFKINSCLYSDDTVDILCPQSLPECVAIMGNVPYNIPEGVLRNIPYSHRDNTKFVLKMYFKIGELDIEASRENIETTVKNSELITKRYEQAYNKFTKLTQSYLKDIDDNNIQYASVWDKDNAKCLVYEVFGLHISYIHYVGNGTIYNTFPKRKWSYHFPLTLVTDIKTTGDFIFIEVPDDKKMKRTQLKWIENNLGYKITVIYFHSKTSAEVIKEFGILPEYIVKSEDVPAIKVIRTKSQTRSAAIIGYTQLQDSEYEYSSWQGTNSTTKGVYDQTKDLICRRAGNKIVLNNIEHNPVDIFSLVKLLNPKIRVFGVRLTEYDKAIKNSPVLLEDWIKQQLQAIAQTYAETLKFQSLKGQLGRLEKDKLTQILNLPINITNKKIYKDLHLEKAKVYHTTANDVYVYEKWLKKFNVAIPDVNLKFSVEDIVTVYNKKYFVLDLVNSYTESRYVDKLCSLLTKR